MKKEIYLLVLLMLFCLQLITACKKDNFIEIVDLTLDSVNSHGYNGVLCYGHFVINGDIEGIERKGVCWSHTNSLPTLNDNQKEDKNLDCLNCLDGEIMDLGFEQIYYFRPYVITRHDTIYGNVIIFSLGHIWRERSINLLSFHTINTVSFINSNRGWIAGYGELRNTNTRGETWANGPASFYNQDIKKVVYVDSLIAYMNVSGALKKTIDGGSYWNSVAACSYGSCISIFNSNFICIGNTDFNYSVDGGANWNIGDIYVPSNFSIADIKFTSTLNGFLLLTSGYVYETTTGGSVWEIRNSNPIPTPSIDGGNVLYVFNSNEIIVGRGRKLFKSNDSGVNWDEIYEFIGDDFVVSMDFANDDVGICSFGNAIVRTEDGGYTWTEQKLINIDSDDYYFDLKLITPYIGIAGYSHGIMVYY